MKIKYEKEFLDAMSRNPANWKGPFYFNRKDPRIMVPKLHPAMGWTLNFSSPLSYLTLIALAAVIVIISIITK